VVKGKKNKTKIPKKGRPYKKEGHSVREDLILAGAELLKNSSLEELSLRKVASLAGVSHVATYHHFQNKNALLASIAEVGFQKYFQSYKQELGKISRKINSAKENYPVSFFGESGEFYIRFRALGWTYVKFTMSYREYSRIMFGGAGLDLSEHPRLSSVSRRTYRQLHEIVRMGQRIGAIAKGNTREKTLASWAMIHGIAMLLLEGRLKAKSSEFEMEEFVYSVTNHVFLGMKR